MADQVLEPFWIVIVLQQDSSYGALLAQLRCGPAEHCCSLTVPCMQEAAACGPVSLTHLQLLQRGSATIFPQKW